MIKFSKNQPHTALNTSPSSPSKIALTISLLLISQASIQSQTPNRSDDPVILKGPNLTCLLNNTFTNKVAFKYDNGWIQVPIQFDEMELKLSPDNKKKLNY